MTRKKDQRDTEREIIALYRRRDEDAIRREVRETAEACMKYGCPWDYTLKDISTVSYKIENLTRWNEVVQETLDEYYDR